MRFPEGNRILLLLLLLLSEDEPGLRAGRQAGALRCGMYNIDR